MKRHTNIFFKSTLIILALVCIIPAHSIAQTSTKGQRFWIGLLENISLLFNGDPAFGLVVTADEATNGTIIVPQTGLEIPFSINAGETQELFLPDAVWYTQGTEMIGDKGILVETDQDIHLQVFHYRVYFSESSTILPETILNSEYLVLAGKDLNQNTPSSLVIVATEDNTEIEITPSVLTQGLHAPGIPFSITLNEGQNYQIHASSDLSGSKISASGNKKIAVFSGAKQADVWCQGDDSHLWEQLPPVSAWRTEFAMVPYLGQGGDPIRIMAAFDSTVIQLNCDDWHVLNEGEWIEELILEPSFIQSNNPILISQFNKSQSCNASGTGGPSFSFLNPIQYRLNNLNFVCPFAEINPSIFDFHRITIISNSDETSGIFIDDVEITGFELMGPGASLAYKQIDLDPGVHQLHSEYPVWTHFYGFGFFDGYAHSGAYTQEIENLLTLDIYAEPDPVSEQYCLAEEIEFSYNSNFELINWQWDFGDETSATLPSPIHIYADQGLYSVMLNATDINGCEFTGSMEIEVLDCSISMNEFNNINAFYIDGLGQLNSNTILGNCNIQAFDSAGRLIENLSNQFLPVAIPEHTFIIRISNEQGKVRVLKVPED